MRKFAVKSSLLTLLLFNPGYVKEKEIASGRLSAGITPNAVSSHPPSRRPVLQSPEMQGCCDGQNEGRGNRDCDGLSTPREIGLLPVMVLLRYRPKKRSRAISRTPRPQPSLNGMLMVDRITVAARNEVL